jgi:DHA2 family multidrug resistance protein
MFLMQQFTLTASYWDFVWPRIVLGIGLGMIFVPLTTVTLSEIPKTEMGNATGIFNLLRNIGGSVGIAVSATLLARYSQLYQNTLVGQVSEFNPIAMERITGFSERLAGVSGDPVAAERGAYAIISGMIHKQSGMLAYNHIFWILGLVFLALIPFLLLLRQGKKGSVPGH